MGVTTASAHFAHSSRDGQAELAWVAWLNTKTVCPQTVTHLNTHPVQRPVTSVIDATKGVTACLSHHKTRNSKT